MYHVAIKNDVKGHLKTIFISLNRKWLFRIVLLKFKFYPFHKKFGSIPTSHFLGGGGEWVWVGVEGLLIVSTLIFTYLSYFIWVLKLVLTIKFTLITFIHTTLFF